MFEIIYNKKRKTQTIKMVRGDDVPLHFELIDSDNQRYLMQEGDILTFSVKKNLNDKECLISKTSRTQNIHISHDETKLLEPGCYVYDLQLTRVSNIIDTVIPPNDFIILPEVTDEC